MKEKGWFDRNWKWLIPSGCLAAALVVVAVVLAHVLLVFGGMKKSAVATEALDRARQDPRLIEMLGQPIEPGWWLSGSISVSGPSGNADMAIPIKGPRGSARLYIVAEKSAGQWTYKRLEAAVKGQPERVKLISAGD